MTRPWPEAVLVVWAGCVIFVTWQSLLPHVDLPFSFDYADKLLHLLAYFGLSCPPWLGFAERPQARAASWAALALGGLLEIGQAFIPGREADLGDMTANALGVGLGVLAGSRLRTLLKR